MNLNNKLIDIYYKNGKEEKDIDCKLYFYWNTFLMLVNESKEYNVGLRQGIRDYIENNRDYIEMDIDLEDSRLDVFYEAPVFEDLRKEDVDIYYYQNFNTSKPNRSNEDYYMSIRNFNKVLEESDVISLYMSILKIYNHIKELDDDNYNERTTRLIEASNYLLECALHNLV